MTIQDQEKSNSKSKWMAEQFYVSATQETLHPTVDVVNEKEYWNSGSDKNCNELWSDDFF